VTADVAQVIDAAVRGESLTPRRARAVETHVARGSYGRLEK
jgi:hypothetical protein